MTTDEFDAIIQGLELTPPGQEDVNVSPEGQAAYIAVEALSQCIGALHATSDVLAILGDEYPDARQVLVEGPLSYLYERGLGGEDRLAVLDILTSWGAGFAGAVAEALGDWLEAHHMPEHIHLWVRIPVLGFMPVMVGYGETNLDMPIPLDFLYPDKGD